MAYPTRSQTASDDLKQQVDDLFDAKLNEKLD